VPKPAAPPSLTRDEITALCLANLLDNVAEQIYFKDLQSRFLRVSAGQATVLGAASPEAVEGTTDFDTSPMDVRGAPSPTSRKSSAPAKR
jgi:hypothetical protein